MYALLSDQCYCSRDSPLVKHHGQLTLTSFTLPKINFGGQTVSLCTDTVLGEPATEKKLLLRLNILDTVRFFFSRAGLSWKGAVNEWPVIADSPVFTD